MSVNHWIPKCAWRRLRYIFWDRVAENMAIPVHPPFQMQCKRAQQMKISKVRKKKRKYNIKKDLKTKQWGLTGATN